MFRKFALVVLVLSLTACASGKTAADKMASVSPPPLTADQMVKDAKASIKEVTVEDVKKLIDSNAKIVILDVRDRDEYITGFIPGAINVSRGMLEFKVEAAIPDKSAPIYVYCGVDLRGPLATLTLNRMGYVNAVNLIGGLKAWKAAGNPTTHYPSGL